MSQASSAEVLTHLKAETIRALSRAERNAIIYAAEQDEMDQTGDRSKRNIWHIIVIQDVRARFPLLNLCSSPFQFLPLLPVSRLFEFQARWPQQLSSLPF